MNTKVYLNYFEEISHLPAEKQLEILEQARYQAFAVLKLNGQSLLRGVAFRAMVVVICFSLFFGFSLSSWSQVVIVVAAVSMSNIADKPLQAPLLQQGLDAYLKKHPEALS